MKQGPSYGHLVERGLLIMRARDYPANIAKDSLQDLARFKDDERSEGWFMMVRSGGTAMTMSGHCASPAVNRDSHKFCHLDTCTCECHHEDKVFSGRGIVFAIIDDREKMVAGGLSTVEVISKAIDEALDNGHEDSEAIARYITTHAFNHVKDRRARFNSVLKASDVVGAQIVRKLINSYNEMMELAEGEEGREREDAEMEARGFATAVQIVLSPFASEDGKDPSMVKWSAVDHMTELFEKEQATIRKQKNGSPR